MIVVKLMGGLGNQMFQYAFGRYLSLKNNTPLKFDSSIFKTHQWALDEAVRSYELNVFNIRGEEISKEELQKFKSAKLTKVLHHVFLRSGISTSSLYVREPHFHFFPRALRVKSNSYIDGYWQSEKYFASIRLELLKEFSLKNPLSDESKKMAEKISSCEAVSVHVRKTDYVKGSANSKIYGELNADYYLQAMKIMKEKNPNASFFIFSDESQWFKNNVSVDFPVTFVDFNKGENSYQDLYLMSLCKHNIIANSSFSWWGAWLNTNENKTVIGPKNWFQPGVKNSKDLLPENWLAL